MRFTKMQGVGNDFVVLDASQIPAETHLPTLAVRLCDRQFGIGADGLLVIGNLSPPAPFPPGRGSQTGSSSPHPLPGGKGVGEAGGIGSDGAVIAMRMFNPDGTEDICGNGMRCVGLWAHRAGWLDGKTEFEIDVLDGPRQVKLESVAEDGKTALLTVDMGRPKFAPDQIPMCGPEKHLRVENRAFSITPVNTGSTHTVIFGDELPDEATFQHFSPLIETHPCFPERTSVLWATPRGGDFIDIRIWERGAGETLGCGTGACAVGVAAHLQGLTQTLTHVVSRGGTLTIDWPGGESPISMTGPAAFVFDGDISH